MSTRVSRSPGRVPRAARKSRSPARKRNSSPGRGRKNNTTPSPSRSNSRGRPPHISKSNPKIKSTITPLLKQGASSAISAAASAGKQVKREIKKLKDSVNSVIPKIDLDTPDSLFKNRHQIKQNLEHELEEISQVGRHAYKSAKSNLVKYTNPKLEFGGPLGNSILIAFLPAFVIYLLHLCDKKYFSLWKVPHFRLEPIHYFDTFSLTCFTCWMLFHAIFYCLPIGSLATGFPLYNGPSLKYRCNGLYAYLISMILFGMAVFYKLPVWKICDHVIPMACLSIAFTFLFSFYLLTRRPNDWEKQDPHSTDKILENEHVKGKTIYRYFMGRFKNPRIGKMFDLKMFFEMRPGLIGWVILDLCYLAQKTHDRKFISIPLLVLCLFHAWYVLDAQWNEARVLSTWDIRHESFGFMLLFGDIVWVPFLYSLQARYLSLHTVILPKWHLGLCIFLYVVGYTIFRMSNSDKALFTRSPNHPKFSHYRVIPTGVQGKKLLAGGFWGLVRHPNYLGDIIIALSMCLLSGFHHVLPYFYFVFLTCLLIHRQIRDEAWCANKYGAAWNEYRRIVRSRIIPFIY
ncbi:unnamed protein product [Gordionus sp. m RMFG-2023]|uniref:delta(14)-sterol reductase TM7SF2-like n=1 Tax=Gordionus sp. m RMFG-2023 TaxID=3053472 RepID=UPI0030E26D2D